jgi:biotin-dependent carboxylase-like uncharacterized protein
LIGGSYRFEEDTLIALTGADMHPVLNQESCPMYQPVPVKAGDILMLSLAVSGCRTYLAVRGGIDVPPVLGSRSTNLKCAMGGFEGRALKAGDILPVGKEVLRELSEEDIKEPKMEDILRPAYPSSFTVRVIAGVQEEAFTEKGIWTFYSSEYQMSEESDRMGCRLLGPAIESKSGTDIVSDGIVFGSIQVTPAGQPIVLMADRQTTGGYAKIATVCSFDLPKLAQCRPSDTIRFQKRTIEEAQKWYQDNRNKTGME